jgi:hypothetical protein
MNVHPFSGRTERPRASIGLAGSRSSIDRDAAVLLPVTHQQQAESRTPKDRSRVSFV